MTKRRARPGTARLTPKQRVLKRWPTAYCIRYYEGFRIDVSRVLPSIGLPSKTPRQAWASAAARLPGGAADKGERS